MDYQRENTRANHRHTHMQTCHRIRLRVRTYSYGKCVKEEDDEESRDSKVWPQQFARVCALSASKKK